MISGEKNLAFAPHESPDFARIVAGEKQPVPFSTKIKELVPNLMRSKAVALVVEWGRYARLVTICGVIREIFL